MSIFILACASSLAAAPIPTNLDNFFMKGTQPDASGGVDFKPIRSASNCQSCHEISFQTGNDLVIYPNWEGSMMANSLRDPVFQAALTIANQDAAFAGDLCLRCHAPGGWLGGRSLPTDGSAMRNEDFEGVTCHFCHRAVDPLPHPENPVQDDPIRTALANEGLLPSQHGSGMYVVDPADVRRGPFALDPAAPTETPTPPYIPKNMHLRIRACTGGSKENMPCSIDADCPGGHCTGGSAPIIYSPFHIKADVCGTCHDVSNPAFTRQPDGTYALNAPGVEHATQNKYDMFPLERTFSEWSNSLYASVGLNANGVFGGNNPSGVVHSCQDCHMPPTNAYGCGFDTPDDPFFQRPDVPSHNFDGGNAWVQDMLFNLYPGFLYQPYLEASKARARYMLQNAAAMELTNEACLINVRVINETAHKLPTGYPEGRRMWINVEFRDNAFATIAERGAYNDPTADLITSDTRVYEAQLGLDGSMSQATGIPEGVTFHFALNNKIYKDNRIPPRGFTNASFAAVQAAPVAADYADGQYWSDTKFHIPAGATSAVVTLYYQTASKEYIEFLRDENETNNSGEVLHEQWQLTGMSPPVLMRQRIISNLSSGLLGDVDCSTTIDLADYNRFKNCVTGPNVRLKLGCEAMDADLDGDVDLLDVAAFQELFTGPP